MYRQIASNAYDLPRRGEAEACATPMEGLDP